MVKSTLGAAVSMTYLHGVVLGSLKDPDRKLDRFAVKSRLSSVSVICAVESVTERTRSTEICRLLRSENKERRCN